MNTLSTKVTVPISREIMGSGKSSQNPETSVDYENELDNVLLSDFGRQYGTQCCTSS